MLMYVIQSSAFNVVGFIIQFSFGDVAHYDAGLSYLFMCDTASIV